MIGFALPNGLKLGDFVLLAEPDGLRGLGQLAEFVEARDEAIRLRIGFVRTGRSVFLREDAAGSLGLPMLVEEASPLLEALSRDDAAPDERGFEDQFVESIKTLARGSWQDVQRRLARLYASPWKPAFGDLRMIDMYEEALVPILAYALGRTHASMVEQLRSGKPVFAAKKLRPAASSPPARPKTPALQGYETLFSFEVTGELWLGEAPDWHDRADSGLVRLAVAPGRWGAYRLHRDADDSEPSIELLLVHASRDAMNARIVTTAPWRTAGEITQTKGSGRICVLDRVALADPWTMDRLRYLGGVRAYGGHAICVATDGWRGPLPVRVSPQLGPASMIRVRLRDDDVR